MRSSNSWRIESVNTAKAHLASTLERFEDAGFEVVRARRFPGTEGALVLLRRLRRRHEWRARVATSRRRFREIFQEAGRADDFKPSDED